LQMGEIQRIGDSKVLKVNTRIIASTNASLPQAIAQNRFRQDLFYRLNILPISIPPLRERGAGDIRALANYFIKKISPGCRLTAAAMEALTSYDWPGNVRELENTIQRALHVCDGELLTKDHLGLPGKKHQVLQPQRGSLREMEQQMIASTLDQTNHNMAETAKRLGISRATLYRKVKQHAIAPGHGN